MAYQTDCRWFSGYKPCQFKRACDACPHYERSGQRIAILSLEAMGAVLRTTCLLPALKRQFPTCHITWITLKNTKPLLENNPFIDRIVIADSHQISTLQALRFDILMAVDKSLEAGSIANSINAGEKRGFGINELGAIIPFNEAAQYQYALGLDDHLKFVVNQKPETQQITETMGLEWKRDSYILELTENEHRLVQDRRTAILSAGAKGVIGYNTGCSLLFPYKKFTVERSIDIIKEWRKRFPDYAVALLGGPEDTERQAAMKQAFLDDKLVVNTPTREGLRSGILWMDTADLVLSGCSLGLHIAIALKKPVIAWFGVSCIQEIDIYDRGVKIQSEVQCSPCWKKSCDETIKCFNQVSSNRIAQATHDIIGSL